MWEFDSFAIRRICTSWNIGVRTIFNLPYTTHMPIAKQYHMSLELYKRSDRFLYGIKQCRNYIVTTCLSKAMYNARAPLGHNVAFFRNNYGIVILCHYYNICMSSIRKPNLKTEHLNISK